jgi:hypothetical protein
MLNSSGDRLLFTDADLSSPIEEAEKLLAALDEGAHRPMGSRCCGESLQTERQPIMRQVLGRVFNLVLRMILAWIQSTRKRLQGIYQKRSRNNLSAAGKSNAGASIQRFSTWRRSLIENRGDTGRLGT